MMICKRLSLDEFNETEELCERWSEKSLQIAKELLVDGLSLSVVAEKNNVSSQHANVLRTRFLDKYEKRRLNVFMEREKPEFIDKALDHYKSDIKTLHDSGYTNKQIVTFLEEQEIEITEESLTEYMRGLVE
jgi:predicted DNA-binding protein YlxM (UPF0122 family)